MRPAALLLVVASLLGCESAPVRAQGADTAQPRAASPARATSRATSRASDTLSAQLDRAIAAWNRGDHRAAYGAFERIAVAPERSSRLTAVQLIAVGTALRYLGRIDHQRFHDARRAFEAAAAADPTSPEPLVRLGELFLDKYNSADANDAFQEALRIAPRNAAALLGVARRLQFDGQPGVLETTERSLRADPEYAPARLFRASLHLDDERYAEARAEVERVLARDSTSLEAWTMLAAVHHMSGDEGASRGARARIEVINPRYSDVYETLAELSARHRLYADAAEFARRGVAVDSTAWSAWGLLGINALRIGEVAAARGYLETSFRGDPFNIWIKNTLDLLDTHKRFTESTTARYQLLVDSTEADLLAPYLAELGEEAYAKLAERYGWRPSERIRLEVYRRHADFSVRTVGLTGMGALGVSFGRVLAMDSPAARERGSFNWGSTAWHEIAHTFTLGVTDHRIPRWLSEGLSVLEERRARRGWGSHGGLDFVLAIKQGRILPVSRMSEAFVRPTYPAQISHAYYQASLVCEMIERDFGWEKMRALLAEFRRGSNAPKAFRGALGIDLGELDRRFDGYLRERFGQPLAALDTAPMPETSIGDLASRASARPNDLRAQLAAGRALVEAERGSEAVPFLERAKAIYPGYGGPDSPYLLLARVFQKSDLRRAAAELAEYTALNETDYEANLVQAGILEQLGDRAGSQAALERAVWIHPYDPAVHERLATLYSAAGDHRRAVRERGAVVALDPVDRPEALYQLALAQYGARDIPGARRSVLAALEAAPGFEKAQSLLLEIRRSQGGAR